MGLIVGSGHEEARTPTTAAIERTAPALHPDIAGN